MKTTLTLEDIGEFVRAVFLFSRPDYTWWWFPALFGYGLKYNGSFRHMHLEWIGK